MSLPTLVGSITPAAREAVVASLQQLLGARLSTAAAVRERHGIGYGKMEFLVAEHGEEAVSVMRALKLAPDPDNLMNPGKIVRV